MYCALISIGKGVCCIREDIRECCSRSWYKDPEDPCLVHNKVSRLECQICWHSITHTIYYLNDKVLMIVRSNIVS